ncbi:MAG: hypothetical protein PG981_001393 [Wolbachia endosymbiont of Ctenocephalides orientis wCori]|nr:MAG: hypothetical protein PG981_001393 [Wolbachia endosymbiont of Ctenocephalides orientis wCori]
MTIKLTYRLGNSRSQTQSFKGINELVDFLKENTHITSLYLTDNGFGKEGAQALAPALKKLNNLISLHVSGNNLGKKGIEALIPALQEIKSFTTLDLVGDKLEEKDLQEFADKLPGCQVHVYGKFYTAHTPPQDNTNTQKFDKKLVGAVAGLVLGAVLGGVIAYALSATTLGIIGGALLGALAVHCIAKVYEEIKTNVDGAGITQPTGNGQQTI